MEKAEKERKYKLAFRFVPTKRVMEDSKQIVKKFKKLEKNGYGFFSTKNWLEMDDKETKIKTIVPFHSNPMRNRKFQTKKIQKNIKYYYAFISSQNKGGNAENGRK